MSPVGDVTGGVRFVAADVSIKYLVPRHWRLFRGANCLADKAATYRAQWDKAALRRSLDLSGSGHVYPAGRRVLSANCDVWRVCLALLDGKRAAGLEWATLGRVEHIRRRTWNGL